MGKWKRLNAPPAAAVARPVTPAQEPTVFFPPLGMQQSVWDSAVSGEFIDAKIFAFSRRSGELPGRVDTPKPLFVNTHVLATACSYFESTFGFSHGIETRLSGGLPPGVEPFFDLEGSDSDNDFDDPAEGGPVEPQLQTIADVHQLPLAKRSIRTYIVKYTAYKTLHAIIWYIYSGEIAFSSGSPGVPVASAKSVYHFADEHSMHHLKMLASEAITASIDKLSPCELVEEACSVSCGSLTSRSPELRRVFTERLPLALSRSPEAKRAFKGKLFAYFRGELSHCKDLMSSTLLRLMDESTTRTSWCEPLDDHDTIMRVSCPWPDRTKQALRMSLESGIFEDFELGTSPGPAAATPPVYLSTAVTDGGVGSSLWRSRLSRNPACGLQLSPSTWQALVYYTYTGCITFKPFGQQNTKSPMGWNPSDIPFRGHPCSMKEMFSLARKFVYDELVDLATTEMVSKITPENVVEETFYGSPLPPQAIDRGVEIMCSSGNRHSRRIQFQLQSILEEAASGSRSGDLTVFSAYFDKLLSPEPSINGVI